MNKLLETPHFAGFFVKYKNPLIVKNYLCLIFNNRLHEK